MDGSRLKKLREKYNLTQKQLGEKINVSEQAIANYESNRRDPDDFLKIKIANFFGVTVDYLLGNETFNLNSDSDKDKELLQTVSEDMANPLSKAIYSKASELKTDKDRQIVLSIIEGFIKGIDENK